MARGLSKSAKYHRAYRFANRIETLAERFNVPCKRLSGDAVCLRLNDDYRMSICLRFGSMSNGESVGRVGAYLICEGRPLWRSSRAQWPDYSIRTEEGFKDWLERVNRALQEAMEADKSGWLEPIDGD